MRKLLAAMKISVDGKITGAEGRAADWVDGWSDDYGLTPQIDACLLSGGMYANHEQYWNQVESEPDKPNPMTGKLPTAGEVEWARVAAHMPHYVLSSALASATWERTKFLRSLEEVAALKQQPGKDIYLIGGGRTASRLIAAGLVDELRLIVYPLIAGEGSPLFATTQSRRSLQLQSVEQRPGGLLSMIYKIG